MITENMQKFIDKNKTEKVIEGTRMTPEDKHIRYYSDIASSDRIRYKFEDGETMTLLSEDTKSAPTFVPEWGM